MLSKFLKWFRPNNTSDSENQTTSQEQSSNVSSVLLTPSHTHSKEGEESGSILETGNTEIDSGEKLKPTNVTDISNQAVEVSNQKVIEFVTTVATETACQTQIPSYHEKIRQELQSQFDNPPLGKILKLTPQEYPGPLTINKPLIIDGQGSTLWALKGPVLSLTSSHVAIKNLNVEVTGDAFANSEEECAICISDSSAVTNFDNVRVRGQVIGIKSETGQWQYPHSLHLGWLAQNTAYQFILRIVVPTQCHFESAISGVQLVPTVIKKPGITEVLLQIDPLPDNICLQGSLYLNSSQLKRRIYLTAHISSEKTSNPQSVPHLLWYPPNELAPLSKPFNKSAEHAKPLNQSVKQPRSSADSDNQSSIPKLPKVSQIKTENKKRSQPQSIPNRPIEGKTYLNRLENSVFFKECKKDKIANEKTPVKEQTDDDQKSDNVFFKPNFKK